MFNLKLWNTIREYIDEIKISMDSLNQQIFSKITNNQSSKTVQTILTFIEESISYGLPVTLNCVYSKLNKDGIINIIHYAKEKNINVSILDLYFSKETEKFWKNNYMNIYNLRNRLNQQCTFNDAIDTYGCDFKYFYYNKENYIRIKSSMLSTMRDSQCDNCDAYCQEGIFSLRLSRQGWVTVCQSNENSGLLLPRDEKRLIMLEQRIKRATKDKDSFKKFIIKNNIKILNSNKIVFPCIGFVWNSLDENQMKEVLQFLNKTVKVRSYKFLNLEGKYKNFLEDIYYESTETNDISNFKVRKLVDKYKSNKIMMVELEVIVSSVVDLNKSKGFVYREIAELKNIIRHKYESIVEDYEFDTVFHLTDDLYEYEYVKKILKKYSIE